MKKTDIINYSRRIHHIIFSFLLISLMMLLAVLLAWLLFGNYGIIFLLIIGIALIILHPAISYKLHLRLRGARKISYFNAPAMYTLFINLVRQAELSTLPSLYYIPEKTLNAFSIGNKKNTSIIITSALINYLTLPELEGVIAHEISHIKNNDMWHLGLAHTVYLITSWLSWLGIIFLIFHIPFLFTGGGNSLWLPATIIFTGPLLNKFLLSTLSRTREYEADIGSVQLTNDKYSFISALKKLGLQPVRLFGIFYIPTSGEYNLSIFRTHPGIRQRIHRLKKLHDNTPAKQPGILDYIG